MSELAERAAVARRRLAKAERRRARVRAKTLDALETVRLALDPETAALKADWLEREQAARWSARAFREGAAEHHYGHTRGAANCASCGHFKSEPAAVCGWCGDDPVSHHGDRRDFNRAHGRAS